MPKPLNKHTLIVRNAVTNWIQRNSNANITVPLLAFELRLMLGGLDIDLGKAISNELTRRESAGFLVCIDTEVVGLGRPPKVYKQKWKY